MSTLVTTLSAVFFLVGCLSSKFDKADLIGELDSAKLFLLFAPSKSDITDPLALALSLSEEHAVRQSI